MGDDEFTQGRPHPMIDPSLRDARIRDEVADPTTAVVLFDVVLGYGSPTTRSPGCSASSAPPRRRRRPQGRTVAFIGYVCGTDRTRRTAAGIVAALKSAGVLVAVVQRRGRHLVGRDHLPSAREPRHEDRCSSRTSRSSTSACRASPTTSWPPAATSRI